MLIDLSKLTNFEYSEVENQHYPTRGKTYFRVFAKVKEGDRLNILNVVNEDQAQDLVQVLSVMLNK